MKILLEKVLKAIKETDVKTLGQLAPELDSAIKGFVDNGLAHICNERMRQVLDEGFTADHDATHGDESLGLVAACYASPIPILKADWDEPKESMFVFCDPWPRDWPAGWDKRGKHDRIKQLAIAGALCAAEIDRLQASVLVTGPGIPPMLCSHLLPGPHAEREGKYLLTRNGEKRSQVICNYCWHDLGPLSEGDKVVPIQHWLFGFPVVLSREQKP